MNSHSSAISPIIILAKEFNYVSLSITIVIPKSSIPAFFNCMHQFHIDVAVIIHSKMSRLSW